MKKIFSKSDVNFLKKFYPLHGTNYCSPKLGFSSSQIIRKAAYLGLKRFFVNPDGTKTCGKCRKKKSLSEFHKRTLVSSGISSRCNDCCSSLQKKYWNNPKIKEKYNKNRKLRLQSSPRFKLRVYLANRIRDAIKANDARKSTLSIDLLGCTVDFYKSYLESKFTPEMNWENYGKWEIDHIRPCVEFDLLDLKQQFECFHYTNTQPLWATQNRRKGGSYAHKSNIQLSND